MDADSDAALADTLSALSYPSRIALLRLLQRPRTMTEIELRPGGAGAGELSPDRPISRQAVRDHVRQLVERGLAMPRRASRSFGETTEYVVNPQRLFVVSEELRALARLRPEVEVENATIEDVRPLAATGERPRLLVVGGVEVGRSFPLKGSAGAQWLIGRRPDAAVPVEHDPFASAENTLVRCAEEGFTVEDLPSSRNGTFVNFERLPAGGRASLAHGDVLGVGRSLFVFHGPSTRS